VIGRRRAVGEGRASLDPEERHEEDIVERWKLLSDRVADALGLDDHRAALVVPTSLNVFVWGC
jgi:hypothetical protein